MPVDQETFIEEVSQGLDAEPGAAAEVVEAVLATLGERLSFEQARKLAATLPKRLGGHLTGGDAGQRFDRAGFIQRVADRTDLDPGEAEEHARVILSILGQAVPADILGKVRDQLPDDMAAMLGPLPGRQEPHPVKDGVDAYQHQPTRKEGEKAGKDTSPRYGKQGAN